MHQYQHVYNTEVKEYLDEALYSLKQESENMTVAELHADIVLYLSAKYDKPWYRFSGLKVARAMSQYRTLVTELLS
jgi:hypothetical protein